MVAISNSFHTSKKAHAISNASSLAKVQKHNSRGYSSRYYDAEKIHNIIGDANHISDDVKDFINEKFKKNIDEYNAKQKRNDRKIKEDPFDYFCKNKNLDICNEMIFQVGDKDFWAAYRNEKIVKGRKKEFVIKSFPDEIKKIMDKVFEDQARAYEKIYETDKIKILNKINEAIQKAEDYMSAMEPETKTLMLKLVKMDTKERNKKIKELDEQTRNDFFDFFEVHSDWIMIKKLKLEERIKNNEMKIILKNLTGHYDEWSPHAHGISVCWTSGYSSGLDERVAKSVVLNKFTLEIIQDKMREIAKEAIEKNKDIFDGVELAKKRKGRNHDYTTEELIKEKQKKLEKEVAELTSEKQILEEKIENVDKEIEILREKLSAEEEKTETEIIKLKEKLEEENKKTDSEIEILQEKKLKISDKIEKEISDQQEILNKKKEEVAEWDRMLASVGDEKAYVEEADKAYGIIETLKALLDQLINRVSPMRDKTLEKSLKEAFQSFYEALKTSIKRMRMYEIRESVPAEKCKSTPLVEAKLSLDKKVTEAEIEKDEQRQKQTFTIPGWNYYVPIYDDDGRKRSLIEQIIILASTVINHEVPDAFKPEEKTKAKENGVIFFAINKEKRIEKLNKALIIAKKFNIDTLEILVKKIDGNDTEPSEKESLEFLLRELQHALNKDYCFGKVPNSIEDARKASVDIKLLKEKVEKTISDR